MMNRPETIFKNELKMLKELSKKANFIQNPLSEEFFNKYASEDDDFKTAYFSDKTKAFYQYLYWKVKYQENINLSLFGVTRGGKTSAGIKLALFISQLHNVEFPLSGEYIFANQTQFLRFFPQLKSKRTYLIDEQKTKRTQLGGYAEESEIDDINKISAKKMFNQIWVTPELIDRGGEYALKTIALDRKLALTKCLIYDLRNTDDTYLRAFGTCIIRHYDISVSTLPPAELVKIPDKKLNKMQLLRKNYEIKKDKGIEQVTNRLSSERATYRLLDALKLSSDSLYLGAKNNTERMIIARTTFPEGYTEDELEEIVKMARNKKILIEILQRKKIEVPEEKIQQTNLKNFN